MNENKANERINQSSLYYDYYVSNYEPTMAVCRSQNPLMLSHQTSKLGFCSVLAAECSNTVPNFASVLFVREVPLTAFLIFYHREKVAPDRTQCCELRGASHTAVRTAQR
jgi:hypothetical protein